MRTNIEIDDELMRSVMEATGLKTKRETVEEALRMLLRQRLAHQALLELRGKVEWDGNLDQMRRNRPAAEREW